MMLAHHKSSLTDTYSYLILLRYPKMLLSYGEYKNESTTPKHYQNCLVGYMILSPDHLNRLSHVSNPRPKDIAYH